MTSLFEWLLDTTVKGSVLIVVVAAIQWLIGFRVDARLRHLLWVVVLFRLLMPSAPASNWSMFNALPERAPAPVRVLAIDSVVANTGFAPAPEVLHLKMPSATPFAGWVVALWLAGAVFFALRIVVAAVRMRRAVLRGQPQPADGALPLIETDAVRTPAVHGMFRPVLLLPRGFRSLFTGEELRHVMLHELWHVRRMDVGVNWLLAVVQAVHWFNPLVWFAASRIREERELACDELALSLLEEEERPDYGRTILKLLERFRTSAPVPALVGIVNQKQKMKRRLTMIASFRNGTRSTALFLTLVCALSVAGLTDGEGKRVVRFIKTLDPAAAVSDERLKQPVSFELTKASLGELLTVISNKTGVAISQDPAVVSHDIQNARFTIKAEEIPARAALMAALTPFELAAVPTAEGMTIKAGSAEHARVIVLEGKDLDHAAVDGDVAVRIRKHEMADAEGKPGKHVVVRRQVLTPPDADGIREMRIHFDENGIKSEGKLTIKIDK